MLEAGPHSPMLMGARREAEARVKEAVGSREWWGLGRWERPRPQRCPPGSPSLVFMEEEADALLPALFFFHKKLEIQLLWEI